MLTRSAAPPAPSPGSGTLNTKQWLCVPVRAEEAGMKELERLWLSLPPPLQIRARPTVTAHETINCEVLGCRENHILLSSGQRLHWAAGKYNPFGKIMRFSCFSSVKIVIKTNYRNESAPGDSQATKYRGILKIKEILKKMWQG